MALHYIPIASVLSLQKVTGTSACRKASPDEGARLIQPAVIKSPIVNKGPGDEAEEEAIGFGHEDVNSDELQSEKMAVTGK
jgi:hypothetical protein